MVGWAERGAGKAFGHGNPVPHFHVAWGTGTGAPADFARVAKRPKAAGVALACQLLLLPAICFGLVLLFRLPPVLAAINSVIAVVTLPVVVNLAIAYFQPGDLHVGLQFKKTVEVFMIARGKPTFA